MNLKIFQNATQIEILKVRDAFFAYSQQVLDVKYFKQIFNLQQRVIPILTKILKTQMYGIQPLYWNFLQNIIKTFKTTTLVRLQQGYNEITNFQQFNRIFYGIFKWYKIAQQLSQKIGINVFSVLQKICRQFSQNKLIYLIQKQSSGNIYLKNFLFSLLIDEQNSFDLIKATRLLSVLLRYKNPTKKQIESVSIQQDTGRIIPQKIQPIFINQEIGNKSIAQQFDSFISHNQSFHTANGGNSFISINHYSTQQRQIKEDKQQNVGFNITQNVGMKIDSLKKKLQNKGWGLQEQQLPIKKQKLQIQKKIINVDSKKTQNLGQNSTIIGNKISSKSIPLSIPNQRSVYQKIKEIVSSHQKTRFIPKIKVNQQQKRQLKQNILLYDQIREKGFKKLFNDWFQGNIRLQGFQQQVFQLIAQYYTNPKTIQFYNKKLEQIIKGNSKKYKWQPINSKPIGLQKIMLPLLQKQRQIDMFDAFPKGQTINLMDFQ